MLASLVGYGCVSAAGEGAERIWESLRRGNALRDPKTGVCRWETRGRSSLETLVLKLESAWRQASTVLDPTALSERWGVVFASTKGNTEDVIWESGEGAASDPLTPVLNTFLERVEINSVRRICVSNACASTPSALFLALHWLGSSCVDHVLVLAADEAGRFVTQGFRSLGAVSPTEARPFAADRDGLQLGEAAAALVLSSKLSSELRIESVAIEAEGSSVTRPSPSGASLARVCRKVLAEKDVELVVAHGTGTQPNDIVEDKVFRELFPRARPLITGTKWCVGHTLGASGAVDLIAASEALKKQSGFCLATSLKLDPSFDGNYALAETSVSGVYRRALITSLGFGGVYAATVLARTDA